MGIYTGREEKGMKEISSLFFILYFCSDVHSFRGSSYLSLRTLDA